MVFYRYEDLFGIEWKGDAQAIQKGVSHYRMRIIRSGPMVELELYPVWDTRNRQRAPKRKESRTEQINLNHKRTRLKITRLINQNFTAEDLAVHLTYKDIPPSPEQARKDVTNYIRRLKAWRQKHGLDELRYLYVIEYGALDQMGNPKRIHIHMLVSGMDRDEAERIWKRGRANSHRLQPDDYNLEGIARYICKLPAGGRQWAASRNLKPPEVRYPRHRVSRRRAAEIARDAEAAQEAIQKQFPGLRVLRVEAKISDYCAGAYIYACMRKEETHEPDGRAAHGRGGGAGGGIPGRTAQRTRKRGGDPAGQKDQGAGAGDGTEV